MRLTHEQLQQVKQYFGVKNLWSFSKVSTYQQCKNLYKLKYVDKIRVKGDSCYTVWGTNSHDLIQDFYEKKHGYKDMANLLEKKITEYNMENDPKLQFPKESQRDAYFENIRHYFSNVNPLPYELTIEKPVLVVLEGLEKYVFQGYIDAEYIDEDGNFIILDFKTSSMSGFTGVKLIEKSQQLMLYALGVHQMGRTVNGEKRQFPLDKIKVRYDMMKYVMISFMQANGKIGTTKAERKCWVGKIVNRIRKDLAKLEYDQFEIDKLIIQATEDNNLECMPQEIRDKYTVSECYIDVPITPEIMEQFECNIVATLDEIVLKEHEDNKEQAFARSHIDNSDSYFCVNLCEMKDHCALYKEYKEHSSMYLSKEQQEKKTQEAMLDILGLS